MEQSLLFLKQLATRNYVSTLIKVFLKGEITDEILDKKYYLLKNQPGFKVLEKHEYHNLIQYNDKAGNVVKLEFEEYLKDKVNHETRIIKNEIFDDWDPNKDLSSKISKMNYLRNQFHIFGKLWSRYEHDQVYMEVHFILEEMNDMLLTDADDIGKSDYYKEFRNSNKNSEISSEKKSKPTFTWEKSDTDFLELITALIETKAINNSSKNLTRKQAIENFSRIFGIEIKDAESKLSRATTRTNPTKFIDELKNSLEEYIDKKFD